MGVGEIGGVLSTGLLRQGHTVVPWLRGQDSHDVTVRCPEPSMVLVAVREDGLPVALAAVPVAWRHRVALVQNELLPPDWLRHDVVAPTAAVIWFEKKPLKPLRALRSSPVAGPAAATLVAAIHSHGVPAHEVSASALPFELVAKNVFILTTNIAGLRYGGVTGALCADHRAFVEVLLDEIIALEVGRLAADWADVAAAAVGREREELPVIDRRGIAERFFDTCAAMPDHSLMGRSAPARLARARSTAARLELGCPTIDGIAAGAAP